ncbi:MAG: VOC family protein [Alphaproteobacteria bacterium]
MSDTADKKKHLGDLTTIEFRVDNSAECKKWYATILGRDPDFVFSDTYFEWEFAPRTWLQIVEKQPAGGCGPIRFMVSDIDTKIQELRSLVGDLTIVDDRNLVDDTLRTVTIRDPGGNCFGFLQALK